MVQALQDVSAKKPVPRLLRGLHAHPFAERMRRFGAPRGQTLSTDGQGQGAREPVVVQKPDVVLDGLDRLAEAQSRGATHIRARVVDLSSADQLEYIAQAVARRDLTDEQRVFLPFAKAEEAALQVHAARVAHEIADRPTLISDEDSLATADSSDLHDEEPVG